MLPTPELLHISTQALDLGYNMGFQPSTSP